jgi:hypothetical protein
LVRRIATKSNEEDCQELPELLKIAGLTIKSRRNQIINPGDSGNPGNLFSLLRRG